jgi:hypothetical protein
MKKMNSIRRQKLIEFYFKQVFKEPIDVRLELKLRKKIGHTNILYSLKYLFDRGKLKPGRSYNPLGFINWVYDHIDLNPYQGTYQMMVKSLNKRSKRIPYTVVFIPKGVG